jgi:tetratricopeptide (TPR) repeat protein
MRTSLFRTVPRKPHKSPADRVRIPLILVVLGGIALGGWAVRQVWIAGRDRPERLWEQAQAAYSSGALGQAEAALARLERQRPLNLAQRMLRAEAARQRGRIDQALAALDGFPDTDPGAGLIWRTRGMLEFERDRPRAAESALLRAVELHSKLAEARRDLISLYTIESRGSELAAQFRALAAIGPLSFDELCLWCLGRRLDVGPADVAARLERMLRNDPDNLGTRLPLAENLRRLGRLAEAEAALAPASMAHPEVRAARASLALDRGSIDVATSLLADGPPDHAALARLRGRLALARRDRAAMDYYRAALAADPDDRDSLFGLGQALRLAGQHKAAAPYLLAAHNRDQLERLIQNARALSRREDPKVLRELGDACRLLGRLPEARAWYQLALARDPVDAELQKRLSELSQADAGIGHAARRSERQRTKN